MPPSRRSDGTGSSACDSVPDLCRGRWAQYSIATGVVVAVGYVATAVITGLDRAGVLPAGPGGLLQRMMIIAGFTWMILFAVGLLRRKQPAATT
jgi:hypothetical protein